MTELADAYLWNSGFLRFLAKGMEAEHWDWRPAGAGGNTAHWLAGHLVTTRRWLLRSLGKPLATESWEPAFGRGARPGEQLPGPAPAELMAHFQVHGTEIAAALEGLDPAARQAPWHQDLPTGPASTWAALEFYRFHENYHLGQIGLLRAQMGLPGIA